MTLPRPNETVSLINRALAEVSDKDWNYSRITLTTLPLGDWPMPYVLWCEWLDMRKKQNHREISDIKEEIRWGERHSDELGILELISLRINKALLESTSDEYWKFNRPVVRVVKTKSLTDQGIETAFWYQVTEVEGEEFDNR
ncbi:MAG: hypothetical protein N3A53_03590 [Verrucomicrobiae bacterium]|nr:hypothetical protein [Verrucomicrobiae bacterium]